MRLFLPIVFLAVTACGAPPIPTHVVDPPAPASTADATAERDTNPADPATETPADEGQVGVLVMAHGGSEAWNQDVLEAARGIGSDLPVSVAFGMANRSTMSTALDELRGKGVQRVAVVRLFLAGASFRDQTLYYLGLSDAPPEHFLLMGPGAREPGARDPIDHGLDIATHADGLLVSGEARTILFDRANLLARDRAGESVLLLAHGMGDDDENEAVLDAMRPVADELTRSGFAAARVATLREDWEEARAVAERDIREFVESEGRAGRRVIVVPARLSGFGPYADVLSGLDYEPAAGLLPHPAVEAWLRSTAARVACSAGWGAEIGPCRTAAPRPQAH